MDAILRFDSSILMWFQDSVRGGVATPIVKVITHMGDKGALWILLTLALLIYPNRKGRRLGLMCGVSMAIGLLVTNLIIKNWVARVRPYDFDNPLFQRLVLIVEEADDWSFPSGHTTSQRGGVVFSSTMTCLPFLYLPSFLYFLVVVERRTSGFFRVLTS